MTNITSTLAPVVVPSLQILALPLAQERLLSVHIDNLARGDVNGLLYSDGLIRRFILAKGHILTANCRRKIVQFTGCFPSKIAEVDTDDVKRAPLAETAKKLLLLTLRDHTPGELVQKLAVSGWAGLISQYIVTTRLPQCQEKEEALFLGNAINTYVAGLLAKDVKNYKEVIEILKKLILTESKYCVDCQSKILDTGKPYLDQIWQIDIAAAFFLGIVSRRGPLPSNINFGENPAGYLKYFLDLGDNIIIALGNKLFRECFGSFVDVGEMCERYGIRT